MKNCKVAVIQAASVPFDRQGCLDKACALTLEAGHAGARLALLPEAFVPAYPRGLGFGLKVGSRSEAGRALWQHYQEQSLDVPGPGCDQLGAAAREAGLWLAIGVIERSRGGTLYCSLLYFSPDGELAGIHRKLKPTGSERLIWGEGDGSTLPVLETGFGRIGGLICWENYMPLARMAMYGQGMEIYLAPTADARDSWQATLQHIALESRCYVLSCNQYVDAANYPAEMAADPSLGSPEPCRGGSAILAPDGSYLAEPLYGREGILYAQLDPGRLIRTRLDFDVVGHYARPDVFELKVDTRARHSVALQSDDGS